jgi:hypothetical protein
MSPERRKIIGKDKIEEYYWAGKVVCYVNNVFVEGTFEEICKRLAAIEAAEAAKGGTSNG